MDSIPLELWNGMSGIMRALGWKRGWFGWIGVCVGNRVCVYGSRYVFLLSRTSLLLLDV